MADNMLIPDVPGAEQWGSAEDQSIQLQQWGFLEHQGQTQPCPGDQLQGAPGTPNFPIGQQGPLATTGYEGTPGPSVGQYLHGFTMQDLEAPDYLIRPQGTIEQIKDNTGQFGFTINLPDERKCTRHIAQTYSQPLGMLLVRRDSSKQPEKTKITFWSREELPFSARLRMVIVSKDEDERRNPIKMCANHQQEWKDKNHAQMEHYIIPAESNIVMCDYQHVHPVLVVPVEYFEKKRKRHLATQEEGYNYTGKFYFPCNTSHLNVKSKSVLLVASLEVIPEESFMNVYAQYRGMGIATVEVRVCASAGRDKEDLEKKLCPTTTTTNVASLLVKGTDDSDSEVCSSEGDEPPTRKKKKMATDTSEAAGSSSDISSSGLQVPEVGVSSDGEATDTTNLLHQMKQILQTEMQKMWMKVKEDLQQMLAEEREQNKHMLEEFRLQLTKGKGTCFPDEQPPTY